MAEHRIAALLDLDPDLGHLLEADRFAAARRELRVAIHTLDTGPWDAARLSGASSDHIGLLVLDGVVAREVLVFDTVSTELLGPGDVVRPWRLQQASGLLRHSIRWNVLTRTRIGLLDRRFGAQLGVLPGDHLGDHRPRQRAGHAARHDAGDLAAQPRRPSLLALFWHLAERWGRDAGRHRAPHDAVAPHAGSAVGARRPTVSTALAELARDGQVVRRDDGTWLLTGGPVGLPEPEIESSSRRAASCCAPDLRRRPAAP